MERLKQFLLIATLCFLITACQGGETVNPVAATSPDVMSSPAAALVIEGYTEANEVLSPETIHKARLLGQLQQPESGPGTIFAYAISPDGTQLAGLSNDLLLSWDLITGKLIFSSSSQAASHLFYAPDKTELYLIEPDGFVTVFNPQGQIIDRINTQRAANNIFAFQTDSGIFAASGSDQTLKIWDLAEREALVTIGVESDAGILSLTLSPDQPLIAVQMKNGVIEVWNWQDKELIYSLKDENSIPILRFNDGSSQLISANDQFISVWSMEDGTRLHALPIDEGAARQVLDVNIEGDYLIAAGQNTVVSLWNPLTGARLGALPESEGNLVRVQFSPEGDMLLTANLQQGVNLWRLTDAAGEGMARANLQVPERELIEAAWTPDRFLILLFDALGPVYVWGIGDKDE
ncbi:hypothetical protein MASR2M15_22800 [Anaerolineales bacterium]